MPDHLTVLFSHPHKGHEVGDRADLTADDARRLVRAGIAVYPTGKPASRASASAGSAAADAPAEPRATAAGKGSRG